jgi:predicted transposase YdaD
MAVFSLAPLFFGDPRCPDPTTRPFKALVEAGPVDWAVLAGQPPAPAAVMDSDIATVSGAADKVLRVATVPPSLLHLEFQSGHDSVALPHLLHLRNTLLENRHGLLVRSVTVLLRPAADSPVLDGEHVRSFPGEPPHVVFRYQVIRVWRLPAEQLLRGGVGTLPLAPISAVTEADLPGIIGRMKERLSREVAGDQATMLWAATYILMGLRYSPALPAQLLSGVLSMKESTTYQAILEEGRAEGRAEGEARGAVHEARKLLFLQARERFGPPSVELGQALLAINDLQRLEELGVRLLRAASWEELLRQP